MGWYCGAGVFGLIVCKLLTLSLALPTFFNNNNNIHTLNTIPIYWNQKVWVFCELIVLHSVCQSMVSYFRQLINVLPNLHVVGIISRSNQELVRSCRHDPLSDSDSHKNARYRELLQTYFFSCSSSITLAHHLHMTSIAFYLALDNMQTIIIHP